LGTDLIVGAAPPEGAGAAAAISETSSELGGALGIAILGSVGTAIYRAAMATAALDGVPPEARRAARDTLGGASAEAARLAGPAGAQLLETARSAFGQAMRFTALVCAIVSALAAVLVVVMLRRVRTPAAAADRDVADRIRRRNRKRSTGVAAGDPSDCRDGDGCYLPLRPATDIDNPIRRTT